MAEFLKEFFRYLPVSKRDQDWGLFAYGGGKHVTAPGVRSGHPVCFDYEPKQGRIFSDQFAVLCMTEGEMEFESEVTGRVTLSRGDVVILTPGVWHTYGSARTTVTSHLWLAFGGSYPHYLLRRGILSRQRLIYSIGIQDRVIQPYLRSLACLQVNPVGIQQALAGSVIEILRAVVAAAEQGQPKADLSNVVRRAIEIMELRVEQPLDLEALTRELRVDYDRFRHVFKQQAGCSPYQYHIELRTKRAQELLLDHDLSAKQVALRLGFQDQYHFSKAFKQKTGESPTEWRKNSGI